MVAWPATRSVSALARAPSMPEQAPSVTYWRARASIAAQALAASSEGKVPSHRSTPGSSTHRRSPHCARARAARWCSRSGLIRASTRRHRRRRRGAVLGLEVRLQGGDHGGRHLGGGVLELLGDHPGPVGVQPARGHRRVQPTQPGLASRTRPGRRRPAAPRCAPAAGRAPPRWPAPRTRSPAHPTTHAPGPGATPPRCRPRGYSGSIAANRAIAASCTADATSITRCAAPTAAAHSSRDPVTADAANAPRKLDQGGLTRRHNLAPDP